MGSNAAFSALVAGIAPELLEEPVNVARVFLHPEGLAPRIVNLDLWSWHVIEALQREATRDANDRLEPLVEQLEEFVPDRPRAPSPDYLGFAVPLRLRTDDGELELMTTVAYFGTAVDVTLAELKLEAFLPVNAESAARLERLTQAAAPAPGRSR